MDPDATLKALRDLLGGDHSGHRYRVRLSLWCEAEELFQALDKWLSTEQGGLRGFLPQAWTPAHIKGENDA